MRACKTIGEYDDAYVARVYGFRDKFHYYRASGSKWWLHKIRVPAFAINARDDPFIQEDSLPTAEDVGDVAPARLIYHDHGGHCGFYTDQATMKYEGEEQLVVPSAAAVPAHGWIAEELSRCIDHIHTSRPGLTLQGRQACTIQVSERNA